MSEMTEKEKENIETLTKDMIKGIVHKARTEDMNYAFSFEEPYRSYREGQLDLIKEMLPDSMPDELKEMFLVKLFLNIVQELFGAVQESLESDSEPHIEWLQPDE